MKNTQAPSILVIQFRNDITLGHERECLDRIIADTHVDAQVQYCNYYTTEDRARWENPEALLSGVTHLLLAGSGALYMGSGHDEAVVAEALQICGALEPLVDYAATHRVPTFGICFGYQVLARHFGGRVETDMAQAETGFVSVQSTEAARQDELFNGLPSQFDAIFGHQDSVVRLPQAAVLLARTKTCGASALRIGDLPMWGVQFHPELTAEDLAYRLSLFPEYLEASRSMERVPVPYAASILPRFIKEIR